MALNQDNGLFSALYLRGVNRVNKDPNAAKNILIIMLIPCFIQSSY